MHIIVYVDYCDPKDTKNKEIMEKMASKNAHKIQQQAMGERKKYEESCTKAAYSKHVASKKKALKKPLKPHNVNIHQIINPVLPL